MNRNNFGRQIAIGCGLFTLYVLYEAYEGLATDQITGRRGSVILSGQDARIHGWEALVVGLMLVGVTISELLGCLTKSMAF